MFGKIPSREACVAHVSHRLATLARFKRLAKLLSVYFTIKLWPDGGRMSYPVQNVFPGILADAWKEEVQRFARENTVARLWNQDSSLWPAEERHFPR